ncbi:hypothetical protein MTYM_02080 [Methylococcales bacterium]|nr:hypothetical protein MTYM_02080 [Methylococcales bacterium]
MRGRSFANVEVAMPKGKPKLKTELMTLRVEPHIKKAAEAAAKHDRRSLTNFIEVLVLEYCKSEGIDPDAFRPEERMHEKVSQVSE